MPFDACPVPVFQQPESWHGFRPTHLSRDGRYQLLFDGRYSVRTGHPPPLRQVATQVRCGTGYTSGIATPDGAQLPPVGSGRRPPARSVPELARVPLTVSGLRADVLNLLENLQSQGTRLPTCGEMATALGLHHGAGPVAIALDALAEHGLIHYWHGEPHQYRGQRIVRLLDSTVELRTDGAPAWIHV